MTRPICVQLGSASLVWYVPYMYICVRDFLFWFCCVVQYVLLLMQSNVMSIKVIYSVVISTCVMYIVPTCMYQLPSHNTHTVQSH